MSELPRKLEALLFVSSQPVTERELREALGINGRELKLAIEELSCILEGEQHGVTLKNLGGGWVIETKPELTEIVSKFREASGVKRVRLSKAAVETAAVIAKRQPLTRSEIDEIRGVNSGSPLAKLLELGLVRTSGQKNKNSHFYVTTPKFLETFGINDINDIPALEDLES